MFFPNKLEINSAFAEASRALSVNALLTPIDELKTDHWQIGLTQQVIVY